ncbi:MAG: hypothetical protein K1X57_01120 [Gemmataceae bacterium]|nr:hypothetical protein [Gemmataceae bacterium]
MTQNDALAKKSSLAFDLAMGMSQKQAALRAGVSRSTVDRAMAHPEFRRMVAEYRRQYADRALGRLARNMSRAADEAAKLLESKDDRVRLQAVRLLFQMTVRLRESIELEDRLSELEDTPAHPFEESPCPSSTASVV